MLTKTWNSLFIIDGSEKPVPSYFAIYIMTWLGYHNQVFSSFFKSETGVSLSFYDRINAAFLSVPPEKNHWIMILFLTFFVVVVRFSFNNWIYMFREWADNKSQGWLKEKGFKSPVSAVEHQTVKDELTKSRIASDSSYDKAKAAEKGETDAINKLGEFEQSTQAEHYELQQSIDRYKKELDTQSKLKDDLEEQLLNANKMNQEHMSQYSSLEVENRKLNATINILNKDLKSTKEICANWQSDFMNVKNNLIIWGRNSRKSEFEILYKNENDLTESDRELLTRLITTKIDFPEESPYA
jgi:hypothetical protein